MAPNDTSSQPDYSEQIEQLQEQINRAQQTIRQIQNATGTGVGNTTPARTKGGIDIPPVSGLTATVAKSVVGSTVLQVTWIDAPPPTGARIDHYDIYVQSAFGAQTKPTQVASSKQSPAVFSFQPSGNVSVVIFVQTVLSNGQALSLDRCPTTTVVGNKLAPTVISLLQGYVLQPEAQLTTYGSAGSWSTNVLTVSSGTGGALMTIDVAMGIPNQGNGVASAAAIVITIDGSASSHQFIAGSAGNMGSTVMFDTALYRNSNATDICAYYGLGFATSLSVAVTGSGLIGSGSINGLYNYTITTMYSLHA